MLSAAYQQGSGVQSKDPENRLLGRMPRRRLEVEAWRDAILSASGTLDLKMGGAPKPLSGTENRRRTLYGTVTRRDLDDLLRLYEKWLRTGSRRSGQLLVEQGVVPNATLKGTPIQ